MSEKIDSNDFISLYSSLGLTEGSNGLPLHEKCKYAQECWETAKHRFPPVGSNQSHISYPWIGSKYNQSGLFVLGINMNSHGGLGAIDNLITRAQEQIKHGKKRLFAHKKEQEEGDYNYRGSLLFHRLACYSSIYLESKNIIRVEKTSRIPTPQNSSESLNYISFTNQVKCSPDDEKRENASNQRSEPTKKMWCNCNKYILKKELEILLPKCIFILGETDNSYFFKKNILDSGYHDATPYGDVKRAKGYINNEAIDIFIFPHPGCSKGTKLSIFDDLRKSLI